MSREIRRNGSDRKKYRADAAQALADKRRHQRRRGKLDKHPELKKFVVDHLKSNWSPEEIVGYLHEVSSNETNGKTISHESIYEYMYTKAPKYEKLFLSFPQHRPKRRK